jgi:hypothetical protein
MELHKTLDLVVGINRGSWRDQNMWLERIKQWLRIFFENKWQDRCVKA